MKLLTISGSARVDSSNVRLLHALPSLFPDYQFIHFSALSEFPLFTAEWQESPDPPPVREWKKAVVDADGLIICTPEYLHNIPALLKNALEWVTTSGELQHKKVLVITFTPHPPRGEKAMQSLIWSLQALEANVVARLSLYQNELEFVGEGQLVQGEAAEILQEAIRLL